MLKAIATNFEMSKKGYKNHAYINYQQILPKNYEKTQYRYHK